MYVVHASICACACACADAGGWIKNITESAKSFCLADTARVSLTALLIGLMVWQTGNGHASREKKSAHQPIRTAHQPILLVFQFRE
jgi:hypothetical protein